MLWDVCVCVSVSIYYSKYAVASFLFKGNNIFVPRLAGLLMIPVQKMS